MSLKNGNKSVIRLYKADEGRYEEVPFIPTNAKTIEVTNNPSGNVCDFGVYAIHKRPVGEDKFFECVPHNPKEVKHLQDTSGNTIHKRVTITFNANGGSGGSSQTRTWGVEQTTQPPTPTRSGHLFKGWATTSGAATPNITFPRATPKNNTTYYAVWEQEVVQPTWQYNKNASTPFCNALGYKIIGTACTTIGQIQTVAGSENGYSANCIEVICKV